MFRKGVVRERIGKIASKPAVRDVRKRRQTSPRKKQTIHVILVHIKGFCRRILKCVREKKKERKPKQRSNQKSHCQKSITINLTMKTEPLSWLFLSSATSAPWSFCSHTARSVQCNYIRSHRQIYMRWEWAEALGLWVAHWYSSGYVPEP